MVPFVTIRMTRDPRVSYDAAACRMDGKQVDVERKDWRLWACTAAILLVAVADPFLPKDLLILSFLWVPVVASAAFAGPRTTAALAGLAATLNLAVGLTQGYTAAPTFWVRLVSMTSVGLLAVLLSAQNRQAKRDLERWALTDPLTGLGNRRMLLNSLQHALLQRNREQTPIAVLFIDLDHFKEVNTAHTHTGGDDILRQVSQRLRECLRAGDTLTRSGGDEFVAVCPDCHSLQDSQQLAARIVSAVARPFTEPPVTIGATVGAVVLTGTLPADAHRVLKAASEQLIDMKNRQRRGTYEVRILP